MSQKPGDQSYRSMFDVCGLGTLKSLGLLVWTDDYISSTCMEDIACVTSLEFLQLSCDQCDKLPDLINLNLLRVVQFDIAGKISKLSGVSCKLTKLQHLKIRIRNELDTCMCFGMCNLMALKELKIEGAVKVEEVFDLGKLTNLEKLIISGCQSVKALLGLDDLVALKSLHVSGCECDCCEFGVLHSLPRFSKLPNLQKLDISYQKFITALEGLSEAVPLQELKAAHCYELREIPDIGKLTNLQLLDISWCSMQVLSGLGELVALKELVAQHFSELSEIPDLHKLSNLQKLDLRWCALRTVPGLDGLGALRRFFVPHCDELVALPELCKLRDLRSLDIRHCSSLKSLSSLESLSNLTKLKGDWQLLSKLHKLPARLWDLTSVGWGSQGLSISASLGILTIRDCRDELNSLPLLPSVISLKLKRCNFRAISGLINCTVLRKLEIYSCRELERLPHLPHLELLRIKNEKNLKTKDVFNMGDLAKLQNLWCRNLTITELPDLSRCCPNVSALGVRSCKELRSLTSSGPLTALSYLLIRNCGSLRELPDLKLSTKLETLLVRECGVRLTKPHPRDCGESSWPNVEWEPLP